MSNWRNDDRPIDRTRLCVHPRCGPPRAGQPRSSDIRPIGRRRQGSPCCCNGRFSSDWPGGVALRHRSCYSSGRHRTAPRPDEGRTGRTRQASRTQLGRVGRLSGRWLGGLVGAANTKDLSEIAAGAAFFGGIGAGAGAGIGALINAATRDGNVLYQAPRTSRSVSVSPIVSSGRPRCGADDALVVG